MRVPRDSRVNSWMSIARDSHAPSRLQCSLNWSEETWRRSTCDHLSNVGTDMLHVQRKPKRLGEQETPCSNLVLNHTSGSPPIDHCSRLGSEDLTSLQISVIHSSTLLAGPNISADFPWDQVLCSPFTSRFSNVYGSEPRLWIILL
jgi:hypothetical protein